MTKQVTREQLNQLLEQEVDRYIQEELIHEGKIGDFFKFFKNNSDKFKDSLKAFLQAGANAGVGWIVGGIGGIVYATLTRGEEYLDWVSSKIGELEYYIKIPGIGKLDESVFREYLGKTADVIVSFSNTAPATFGAVIGIIAALVFTAMQQRLKSPEKAKKKVNELLRKNDELEKDKQKVCDKLAKEVYS